MKIRQIFFSSLFVIQIVILGVTLYFIQEIRHAEDDCMVEEYSEEVSDLLPLSKIPFKHYIEGVGIVKPSSDYIRITPMQAGLIKSVCVDVSQKVKKGDTLFEMDNTSLITLLDEKLADYELAQAHLNILETGPLSSELKIKQKLCDSAQIRLNNKLKENKTFDILLKNAAISENEKQEVESNLLMAKNDLEKSNMEFEMIKKKQEAKILLQKAKLEEHTRKIEILRKKMNHSAIDSPIEGTVLDVTLHPGEYVNSTNNYKILIANEDKLHLQVLIDEEKCWRISPTSKLKALAKMKSNPDIQYVLTFLYAKPKIDENNSKLEIVFSLDKGNAPIYLEQKMSVYIEAAPESDTSCLEYQFNQRNS